MRTRTELQVEKENRALGLRRDGLSYRAICAEIGWKSPQAAKNAVVKALGREPVENRKEVLAIELEKLDRQEVETLAILRRHHYVVAGKDADVVRNPETGEFLDDDAPKIHALIHLLKVQQRRAAMLGLDEPKKAVVTVMTEDVLDANIRLLEAQLAERANGDRRAALEDQAPERAAEPAR